MTNAEAIEILDAFRDIQVKRLEGECDGYVKKIVQENLEAFTMAISALRREDSTRKYCGGCLHYDTRYCTCTQHDIYISDADNSGCGGFVRR